MKNEMSDEVFAVSLINLSVAVSLSELHLIKSYIINYESLKIKINISNFLAY